MTTIKLTPVQVAVLLRLVLVGSVYTGAFIGQRKRTLRSLVKRGLVRTVPEWQCVESTPAGRAWLKEHGEASHL